MASIPVYTLVLSALCLATLLYIKFIKTNARRGVYGTMIILILLLSVCAYCIMLIDTNPLMDEVKDVFLGKLIIEETQGFPIDRYNLRYRNDAELLSEELSIVRLFTIHNFREGYIWARYTHYRQYAERQLSGSYRVTTKWRIEKVDRKWRIVEIHERP